MPPKYRGSATLWQMQSLRSRKLSHSPVPLGQYRCVFRSALYGLRGVRVGEAQNTGPSHAKRRRWVSDSEVSSTSLDGFEADLRNDVTQLSPTVPEL